MAYTRQEKEILAAFGRRVRLLREARGWSQEDLAYEAGLDRTYVGGIERGERNIALLNLNKIAGALNEGFGGFFPYKAGKGKK